MKAQYWIILINFWLALNISCTNSSIIDTGQQPQVTMDYSGIIRVIYGQDDYIFCASSTDNGKSFLEIQVVGKVKDMHLGMTRGPQVASSKDYTLVSAIDKDGTIHSFQLDHVSNKWKRTSTINDIANSAPEGLMDIAADSVNNFYAVWLDIRDNKRNKISYSATFNYGKSWSKNIIAYKSPDEHVCECCQPNIYATQTKVYIMFRNWLGGSRDLYLLNSDIKEAAFGYPQKLGNGTWKLNGCPMDGGGIIVDKKANIHTVWQRDGQIFYSQPGKEEKQIGLGRGCNISEGQNPIITWQYGDELKIKGLNNEKEFSVGKGGFIKAIYTKSNKIFCVWENNGQIEFQTL